MSKSSMMFVSMYLSELIMDFIESLEVEQGKNRQTAHLAMNAVVS